METANPAERARNVANLLRLRSARDAGGGEGSRGGASIKALESLTTAPVHPDDVLARLDDVIRRMPASEIGDSTQFKQAMSKVLEHGEPALKKVLLPTLYPPEFSQDQVASLEAVVIADGTRPSFLLREGRFAPDHPFLGTWKDDMTGFQPALRRLAGSVGRLQLPSGGPARYNGTGVLVDADDCLVLTNYHVVVHARDISNVRMSGGDGKLRVDSDWVIDFAGEVDTAQQNRWRVKEVRLPIGFGTSFAGVDAVVLRIEPFDAQESQLPQHAVSLSGDPNYASGAAAPTLVTIGFPGPPDKTLPPGATVDWNFVVKTLFNDLFGVKRVAPGEFRDRVGTVEGDPHGHVLTHDATTFGGASGSPILAWKDDSTPAFALHFAGMNTEANYAVSLHKTREVLSNIGAPIP